MRLRNTHPERSSTLTKGQSSSPHADYAQAEKSDYRPLPPSSCWDIAGLALITFVCFRLGFGIARTGFAYLILIALVSLLGSFSASVVLSIVAAACLNYFFAPPLFEFRIDAPDDIVRIAAFLTTSLVVTALITKLRASEARFRAFVDHASDAFFLLDEDWTVLDVNQQACIGLGYSRQELIGKHKSDFDVALDDASIQAPKAAHGRGGSNHFRDPPPPQGRHIFSGRGSRWPIRAGRTSVFVSGARYLGAQSYRSIATPAGERAS